MSLNFHYFIISVMYLLLINFRILLKNNIRKYAHKVISKLKEYTQITIGMTALMHLVDINQ